MSNAGAAINLREGAVDLVDSIDWEPEWATVGGGLLASGAWDVEDVRGWLHDMAEFAEHNEEATEDTGNCTKQWGAAYLAADPRRRERVILSITQRIRQMQLAEARLTVLAARCLQANWNSLPGHMPLDDRPVVSMAWERCYLCRCRFRNGEQYRVLQYVSDRVKDHYKNRVGAQVSGKSLFINLCYRCLHTTPRREKAKDDRGDEGPSKP